MEGQLKNKMAIFTLMSGKINRAPQESIGGGVLISLLQALSP